jgi:hypothetical protein
MRLRDRRKGACLVKERLQLIDVAGSEAGFDVTPGQQASERTADTHSRSNHQIDAVAKRGHVPIDQVEEVASGAGQVDISLAARARELDQMRRIGRDFET